MLDHDYTAEAIHREANLKIPAAEPNCEALLKELYTNHAYIDQTAIIDLTLIKQLSLIWKFRHGHKLTLPSGYMKERSK